MLHYRDFLKNTLIERTRKNPVYSLRAFARDLGFSPAYLSQVLNGKRGLTEASARKVFSKTLPSDQDQKWFDLQIKRERVRNAKKVKWCDQKIAEESLVRKIKSIPDEDFEQVSEWYGMVILQALTLKSAPLEDESKLVKWLATRLGIPKTQVSYTLTALKRMQVIAESKAGLQVLHHSVLARSDIRNDFIRKFHRQIIEKSLQAIQEQAIEKRSLCSIQLSIRKADYLNLERDMIRFARSMLLKYGRQEQKDGELVYGLNQQLFELFEE